VPARLDAIWNSEGPEVKGRAVFNRQECVRCGLTPQDSQSRLGLNSALIDKSNENMNCDDRSSPMEARLGVMDLQTGDVEYPKTRSDTVCHFLEPFDLDPAGATHAAGDHVWMRLDWKACNDEGHPMLDTDFFGPDGVRRRLRRSRRDAHHAISIGGAWGMYDWRFGATRRRLLIVWSVTVQLRGVG